MDANNNSKSRVVYILQGTETGDHLPGKADVGEVAWTSPEGTEVHVVHRDRTLGRGPWIFHPSQVQVAQEDCVAAYEARCEALASAW